MRPSFQKIHSSEVSDQVDCAFQIFYARMQKHVSEHGSYREGLLKSCRDTERMERWRRIPQGQCAQTNNNSARGDFYKFNTQPGIDLSI